MYLAVLAIVSHRAGATVASQAIGAGASVLTGLRVALILLVLTECPVETRTATAREGVDFVNASSIIQTGAGRKEGNKVVSTDPPRVQSLLSEKDKLNVKIIKKPTNVIDVSEIQELRLTSRYIQECRVRTRFRQSPDDTRTQSC